MIFTSMKMAASSAFLQSLGNQTVSRHRINARWNKTILYCGRQSSEILGESVRQRESFDKDVKVRVIPFVNVLACRCMSLHAKCPFFLFCQRAN